MGRVQLPNSPIYVPEDSDETMPACEWASSLSILDGALNPIPLCDLDQPMLKDAMAENLGLVSYIPTGTYFTKIVHIKCRGCPILWGCSMVCIGKDSANCSKKCQFLPVMCALCTLCAYCAGMPPKSPILHRRPAPTPQAD